MASIDLLITSELRHIVWSFLDNNLLSNALFFAARLQAHEPSADSSHLLSLCHFRLNQYRAGAHASERFGLRGRHLGCAYIYAQCCLALEQYKDGIIALQSCKNAWNENESWETHSEQHRQNAPDFAAIQCLLGKLYHNSNDTHAAIEAYSAAIKQNPFMWDAFTGLCELGVTMQFSNVSRFSSEMLERMSRPLKNADLSARPDGPRIHQLNTNKPKNHERAFANSDPFGESTKHNSQIAKLEFKKPTHEPTRGAARQSPETSSTSERSFLAPEPTLQNARMNATKPAFALSRSSTSLRGRNLSSSYEVNDDPLQTPPEPTKSNRFPLPSDIGHASPQGNGSPGPFLDRRKRTASGLISYGDGNAVATRRSVRLKTQHQPLNMSSSSSTNLNDGHQLRVLKGRNLKRPDITSASFFTNRKDSNLENRVPRSGPAIVPPKTIIPATKEQEPEIQAIFWVLNIVDQLGHGHYLLNRFECEKALQIFKCLPASQQETSWVLLQMARAYFEQASYSEAAKLFKKARTTAPSSMQDMEIFSTTLWHLKSDLDLALLSHELIELDRLSPESWCAMGNSFSLQHDHENAIKSFKRATQLDPKFAYAYTLEGHERLANEEYEEAIHAFRKGVAANKRHYNAWYGLGIVFQRLGKYDVSEKHFRIAFQINPRNAVLAGCIGMALWNRKEYAGALECYKRACDLSPDSTLARERKAEILLKLHDFDNAATELFALKQLAPRKPYVYVLLGRMFRMTGDNGKALQNFTIALSLNPEASSSIREDMEALKDENNDVDMVV